MILGFLLGVLSALLIFGIGAGVFYLWSNKEGAQTPRLSDDSTPRPASGRRRVIVRTEEQEWKREQARERD